MAVIKSRELVDLRFMARTPSKTSKRSKPRPFSDRLRRLADLIDADGCVVNAFSEKTEDGGYADTETRSLKISVDVPEGTALLETA